MIKRKSKAKCPAVRAVNDWMRHTGKTPTSQQINEYVSLADACHVETTPEAFDQYMAGV